MKMKRAVKVVVLGAVMVLVGTGCSASTRSMFNEYDIQISATEEGMKAYGDHLNALITNGKASSDAPDTPAYGLRREQEIGYTQRKLGWKPNMQGRPNQPAEYIK